MNGAGLGSKILKPGYGCAGAEGEMLLWERHSAGPLKGSSGHERDFFLLADIQPGVSCPQTLSWHLFLCPAVTPKSSQALFSPLAPTEAPCLVKHLPRASAPGPLLMPGTVVGSLLGAQQAPSCYHGGSSAVP